MPRQIVILMLFLLTPASALAQVKATLAFPPRGPSANSGGGGWELLRIQTPPNATRVGARDARGGPLVLRTIAPGETGLTCVPLPLIAPPANHQWTLDITVETDSGPPTHQQVTLDSTPAPTPTFRVILPEGTSPLATAVSRYGQPASVTAQVLTLPPTEILSAPPLVFAAVDALLQPPTRIRTPTRTAALAAAGAPCFTCNDPADARYQPLAPNPPAKPMPVELNLTQNKVPALFATAQVSPHTRRLMLALPLAALVLLALARGLFRRPTVVLLAAAIALAGLGAGAVALIRAHPELATQEAAWRIDCPDHELTEQIRVVSPLFAQDYQTTASADAILFPIAPTPREYFAMDNVTITLSPDGTTLTANIAGRRLIATQSREVIPGPHAPPSAPSTPIFAVEAGHIRTPADGNDDQTLSDWLNHLPDPLSAQTWYQLRFDGRKKYAVPPQDSSEFHLFDDSH